MSVIFLRQILSGRVGIYSEILSFSVLFSFNYFLQFMIFRNLIVEEDFFDKVWVNEQNFKI